MANTQQPYTYMETVTSQVEDVSKFTSELRAVGAILPYRQNAEVPEDWKPPLPLHPTPYALHAPPYTLHPTPATIHPQPVNLTPSSSS